VRIANARELENHTVLEWDPVCRADQTPDPAVAYEILFRETDQPEWQMLGKVALDASQSKPIFQCPLSKDNYFFAVRSVSPSGHPSLPAVAR